MITDVILNVVFSVLNGFVELLPVININYNPDTFQTFFNLVHAALWILPFDTVLMVFSLQVGLTVFRIIVSLVRTLWDLLPML